MTCTLLSKISLKLHSVAKNSSYIIRTITSTFKGKISGALEIAKGNMINPQNVNFINVKHKLEASQKYQLSAMFWEPFPGKLGHTIKIIWFSLAHLRHISSKLGNIKVCAKAEIN